MRSTVGRARERTRSTRRPARRDYYRGPEPNRLTPPTTRTASSELSPEAPGTLALRRLANLVARYAPHDGAFPLRLPGTTVVRRSQTTSEPTYSTVRPAVCMIAQGAKVVMVGRDVLEY